MTQKTQVQSLGQEDPLEKEMQPTIVFLLAKSHGQRNLVVCSPWGCKELDVTEHSHICIAGYGDLEGMCHTGKLERQTGTKVCSIL